MKKVLTAFMAGMFQLLVFDQAMAAVPVNFTHHGLMIENGVPVNGVKAVTATLYDDSRNLIIGNTTQSVGVVDGYYSMTIENIDENLLRAADKVTLALKVNNGAEMVPRLTVNSVPYSLVANYAEKAGYLECEGCISAEHLDFDPAAIVANLKYAKSDEVGGAALVAKKLDCQDCVTPANVQFNYAAGNGKNGEATLLADGVVYTTKLVDDAVTTPKIANKSVDTNKITDGAVTEVKLGPSAVTTTKIADLAVTEAKLSKYAVTSEKIGGNAVKYGHLADNAVMGSKIADNGISTNKLQNYAITSEKIALNAINSEKISDGAIEEKLNSESRFVAKAWGMIQHITPQEVANLGGTTNLRRGQNWSTIDINNDGETIRVNFKKKMNSAYYTVIANIFAGTDSDVVKDKHLVIEKKTADYFDIGIYDCSGSSSCRKATSWHTKLNAQLSWVVYEQ